MPILDENIESFNPREIESILTKNPKMVIRMKKNNSKYTDIKIDYDVMSVKSLNEIIESKVLN